MLLVWYPDMVRGLGILCEPPASGRGRQRTSRERFPLSGSSNLFRRSLFPVLFCLVFLLSLRLHLFSLLPYISFSSLSICLCLLSVCPSLSFSLSLSLSPLLPGYPLKAHLRNLHVQIFQTQPALKIVIPGR